MKDGGPAFPVCFEHGGGECLSEQEGMTLRDYFAAKAMEAGLHGATLPSKQDRDKWLPLLAGVAYEMADAMLKARES